MARNAYQLRGRGLKNGYDWWWHSLVATHRETGTERPFFMEYYVINPGLSPAGAPARLGDGRGGKPSYAMLKAGAWGTSRLGPAIQIDNCWPVDQFRASRKALDVGIGPNRCTETELSGAVFAGQKLAPQGWPAAKPGPGVMTWDLKAKKTHAYSVGYGASWLFRTLRAFRMFWHVEGMRTEYAGTITLDGEVYDVVPERSCGYQDKNWGSDYTNPWIWLNCNRYVTESGEALADTSLDVGGGRPVVGGFSLPRRILTAFWHKGRLEEFNFSHFWTPGRQDFRCSQDSSQVRWEVEVENRTTRLEIDFCCPKAEMILVDYENPAGYRNHRELWNGGGAAGTVKVYRRANLKSGWILEDTLRGSQGGCEYGEHPESPRGD